MQSIMPQTRSLVNSRGRAVQFPSVPEYIIDLAVVQGSVSAKILRTFPHRPQRSQPFEESSFLLHLHVIEFGPGARHVRFEVLYSALQLVFSHRFRRLSLEPLFLNSLALQLQLDSSALHLASLALQLASLALHLRSVLSPKPF